MNELKDLPPLEASPTLKSKAELLVYEQKSIEKQQAKLREETAEVWAEFLKDNGLDKTVNASAGILTDTTQVTGILYYDKKHDYLCLEYTKNTSKYVGKNVVAGECAAPKWYTLTAQMRFVQQNYKPYTEGE